MRWLLLCAFAIGCYSPAYRDCEIACANGTCPSGLECTAGACRLPGMTTPCSEVHDDDAGVDAPREITLDELREAQLNAICSYYVRCGVAEAVASCIETFSNQLLPLQGLDYRNQSAAVAAGKVVFNADKAAECFAAIDNLSCDRGMSTAGPLACQQIFSGTVGDAGPCAIAEECISQQCMTTSCTNGCCTGTCMGATPPAMKNVSESCTYRDRCINGFCDQFTMTCVALKAQGANCTQTAECTSGLVCRNSGTNTTCEMPASTLGVCNTTNDCKLLSDVCSAGKCQTGGLQGFSCPSGNECQMLHQCTSTSTPTCTIPPAIGEACPNNAYCRTGYCNNAVTPMCVARIADGMPCDTARGGQDCESGLCDSATMKCTARPVCF